MSNILKKLVEQFAPETVKIQLRELETLKQMERRIAQEIAQLQKLMGQTHHAPEVVEHALREARGLLGRDLDFIVRAANQPQPVQI